MGCSGIKLLQIFIFFVSNFSAGIGTDSKEILNLLIFGGNGFMGATFSEKVLELDAKVTILNRGNWYWDSGVSVKPFIRHLKCDRFESLQRCSDVQLLLEENKDIFFDAVIDFSAYHPGAVTDALDVLRGRIGKYIFISSDSVYEVCSKTHSEPSRESDAVRPDSAEERKKLTEEDDYGHRKLACEEVLINQRAQGGIPFLSLRIPDVIGPRDNTYRWWIYQMWIKLYKFLDRDVSVPDRLKTQPISLVYSNDVADIIIKILNSDLSIYDQSYNLAFVETPTLDELLKLIQENIGTTSPDIQFIQDPDAIYLFPSVRLGPIDISHAVMNLNWQPTSLRKAVTETVRFYETAIQEPMFERERGDVIRKLQTHFTSDPKSVIRGLEKEYGFPYSQTREEL